MLITIINSIFKSISLARLQRQAADAPGRYYKNYADASKAMQEWSKQSEARERYIEKCMKKWDVSKLIIKRKLTEQDLYKIYSELRDHPVAGGWIAKHYVPLSSLAYMEPLDFYLAARLTNISVDDIGNILALYWDGKIRIGKLHWGLNSEMREMLRADIETQARLKLLRSTTA